MSSSQVVNGASNAVPSEQASGVMSKACLFKVFFYGWGSSSSYLLPLSSCSLPFKYRSTYALACVCVLALSLSLSRTYIYTHTCWLVYEILLSTYESIVTLRVT